MIVYSSFIFICIDPEDFPLFGTNSCISPSTYTGLFLTSIILASITFLMILVNISQLLPQSYRNNYDFLSYLECITTSMYSTFNAFIFEILSKQ